MFVWVKDFFILNKRKSKRKKQVIWACSPLEINRVVFKICFYFFSHEFSRDLNG